MIPSDHFVRFYNELFKFLETLPPEEMQAYYRSISEHQEMHTLALFKEKGLKGMYEYWDHIRFEENCELELELHEDRLVKRMKKCPSLSKVLDNDASPCYSYCNHCPGWVIPVLEKAGYVAQYDIIDHGKPCCRSVIYPASSGKKSSITASEEGKAQK
ncbi:MAG: hypothetical protein IJS01_03830 [Lentisphaeria bacterium]|nr:hypothetical protein [Lentisphaeria bacterium]